MARPIWDIDLFWHIAAGRAFVEAGSLPTTDIFSAVDPDRTWVTFQWGYQVLVYLLEEAGGLPLVRWVHGVVMWLGLLLFGVALKRRFRFGGIAAICLVALLVVLFGDRIRIRPHVFNLLGWVLLLPDLALGSAHTGTDGLRSRPLLFDRAAWIRAAIVITCWANIHAGGAFLFLVAAATLPVSATLARWFRWPEGSSAGLRSAWTWYLAALLPALAAPNFVRGNMQALSMLEGTEAAIGEWRPSWHFLEWYQGAGLESHLVCGALPTILIVPLTLLGWRCLRSRGRDVPFRVVLLSLALLVLAHRSVRFVFAAAFAAAVMGPWLRHAFRWPRLLETVWRPLGVLATAALVLFAWDFNVTAQTGTLDRALERAFAGSDFEEERFPVQAAEFLQRTGFEGRVFCQANWGGYLLWKLHPKVTVTADGRGNYPRSLTDDLAWMYDRSNMSRPDRGLEALSRVEQYPVDAIVHQHPVWPAGFSPPRSRWVPVLSTPRGSVWIRNTPRGKAFLESLRAREL